MKYLIISILLLVQTTALLAQPTSFNEAKQLARQHIYFDKNDDGTTYCECRWRWLGQSGGRIDFASCNYLVRAEGQRNRAERLEWEHVVPASNFGRARLCWQDGGRANCRRVDPIFKEMEADLHNLIPTVGEINSDRSNFDFGELNSTPKRHGGCDFRVDFKKRTVEPPDAIKGMLSRIYFYMHDRYGMRMSKSQQVLLMAWDRSYPVSEWERKRNLRIEKVMGHINPFVSGEKTWKLE